MAKRLVIIPTYNEAENIQAITSAIRAESPDIDILVVDDGSPDGTGRIAEGLEGVQVLHRSGKQGLGTAYKAGFALALEAGYDQIGQMDADFSHPPAVLPKLFARLDQCDMAMGSRYVPGGGTENWGWHRKLLSSRANFTARTILGLHARDVTSGFRVYRREVLEAINYQSLESEGYAFQVEVAYRCEKRGFRIEEEPIIFVDRRLGTSKMSLQEIMGGVANLMRLRMRLTRQHIAPEEHK